MRDALVDNTVCRSYLVESMRLGIFALSALLGCASCGRDTSPKQGATVGGQSGIGGATSQAGTGGGVGAGGTGTSGQPEGGGGVVGGRPPLTPDGPPYIGTGKVLTQPPYDWVGIIGSGQSLSVGAFSTAVSTTQPYKNLMLLDEGPAPKYPLDGAATTQWKVVPLAEPHRPNVSGTFGENRNYPNNIAMLSADGPYGETPHSGMANAVSKSWAERGNVGDYITAHTAVGVGGFCLQYLAKGTTSYAAALSEARVYKTLADAAGKVYGVGGLIFTHGECDTSQKSADYGEKLYELYRDYNTDLKATTQQPNDLVMLASQQSSVKGGGQNSAAVQLWRAGRVHPGEIVCTGPKYAYGPYYVHLPGPAYERMGEKYGEVFDLIVNQGKAWKPLGPNRIQREGKTITIGFDVPNPPLVWDTHLGKPHQSAHTAWAKGNGFEVTDRDQNELEIASAEIDGTSVKLTLARDPAAETALTVAYAVSPDDPSDYGGRDVDLIGLLRDSNPFVGYAQESIDVMATKGSKTFTATAGAFDRRALMDLAAAVGLPQGTVVEAQTVDSVTLSEPWEGETGRAAVSFHHNHYNYCVHFALDVP